MKKNKPSGTKHLEHWQKRYKKEFEYATEREKEELQKLMGDINKEAKNVVEDYSKNPSKISGSTIQVNENSPYLDDTFKGKSWKKVIKGGVEDALSHAIKASIVVKTKKGLVKKKNK